VAVRRPEQSGFLGLLVLWLLGIMLALVAAGENVVPGDPRFARWVQNADGAVARAVAALGNRAGAYWTGLALSLPLIIGFAWTRRWRPVILLVAVLAIRALNNTIKALVDSPRPTPDLVRVTEDAHGLGFPSGHAMGATLTFGALAVLTWRYLPTGPWRTSIALACLAMIPVVGFGRIQTGAHWPTDVLGGYLLGAAILLTLVIALRLDRPRASEVMRITK
jgi:membrane-associated phospholipid phosphatase